MNIIRVFAVIFLLGAASTLHSFGKNKVVYYPYEWTVLESEHFRIYLPDSRMNQAEMIVETAENAFLANTNTFGVRVTNTKFRIVVYDSQVDFQQNNISGGAGQGTGGFTEFLKGRVVIPWQADAHELRHVLEHELTHAFEIWLWAKGNLGMTALQDVDIPLWLVEGAAEYNSIGVDTECETMMADGVITGQLPTLQELSDLYSLERQKYFYVYKEGQAFYGYLERRFGKGAFGTLMRAVRDTRSLDAAMTNAFGVSFDSVDAAFIDDLRRHYMPGIANMSDTAVSAKKLMQKDSFFNVNAVAIDTNRVAFLSDRLLTPDILIFNRSEDSLERVVRGGVDENFLEFQYMKQNNLSVSSNGTLCFTSRSGGNQVIQLWDSHTRSLRKLELPFKVVYSPDISRDGRRVIFSGVTNGQSDIFVYDLESKNLRRLTDDEAFDSQPRFAGSNGAVFVSDRGGTNRLYFQNLDSGEITGMLESDAPCDYPSFSADGRYLAFVKESVNPVLYVFDQQNGKTYHELSPIGGALSPSFSGTNRLLFTSFRKNSYNLYELTLTLSNEDPSVKLVPAAPSPRSRVYSAVFTRKPYTLEPSIDSLLGIVSVDSTFGLGAMGVLSMSDILGDHRMQLLADTVVFFDTNAFNRLNVDLTYINMKYRHNVGFRIYHYANYFYEFSTLQDFYNMERNYATTFGLQGLYSYPFTTFDRLDVDLGFRGFSYVTNQTYLDPGVTWWQFRNTVTVAFVHDATLEDITGPVDGIRWEAIASKSFRLYENSLSYEKLILDFRWYWLFTPGYSLAFRAVAGKLFGDDRDTLPFSVGGYNSIRGYDLWSFQGDTMGLCNIEFRFPLIARWWLGFPVLTPMPTIWGSFFMDSGSAWDWDNGYQAWHTNSGGNVMLDDLKMSVGFGLRVVLAQGIKLKFDWAAPWKGQELPPIWLWPGYWQIGIDF